MKLKNKKNSSMMPMKVLDKINLTSSWPVISNQSIEAYIKFINSIPLLSEQEEYDLAERWRQHEDVEAARYLVLSHLRLVVSIARGYLGYKLPLADIIQEGTIGLMKAVKKFDARRHVRLVTFVTHWIRSEINEFVIKNWRIVKTVTTKDQRKLFFNLRSNRQDVGHLSETEAQHIAHKLNVDRDDVVDMNMRLTGGDISIMSNDNEYDTFAPIDYLKDDEQIPDRIIEKRNTDKLHTAGIKQALEQLDSRSSYIIQARWLADPESQQTLSQLAKKYGVSAERIRQIEVKAMQVMKQTLNKYK